MSVQVKGSGTIGGLDEGLVVSGIVTSSTQINVGSNIKLGSAGIVTATSFVGSGANLTGITQTTINNNASTKFITGSGSANTLDCEANLSYNNSLVTFSSSSLMVDKGTNPTISTKETSGNKEVQLRSNTTGGLLRTVGSYPLVLGTNQTERLRIDSAGRVQINQTSNITGTAKLEVLGTGDNTYPQYSFAIGVADTQAYNVSNGSGMGIGFSYKHNSSGSYALGCGIRGFKENTTDGNYAGAMAFYTRANGAGASEKLRILSNSQLLHTRTDNTTRFDLEFRQTGGLSDGNYSGIHWTQGSSGNTNLAAMQIAYQNSGAPDFVFYTRQTGGNSMEESVRFTHEGDLCLNQNTNDTRLGIKARGSNTNCEFITCRNTSSTLKMYVHHSGNLYNTNGNYSQISDQSLKENIVDANSQWDDIKNIRIRNFNFTAASGMDTHTQIGCVAQEVETVSPKLVSAPKDGVKTVANSVLYMKAVKALQEAQARIETLEAKVVALEGS